MPDLTTFGQPWVQKAVKDKRDADLITWPVSSLSERWVPDQAGPLRFYYPIRSWRIRSATQLRYDLDDPLHVLWTGRIRSHGRSKETVESDTPSGPILHLERSASFWSFVVWSTRHFFDIKVVVHYNNSMIFEVRVLIHFITHIALGRIGEYGLDKLRPIPDSEVSQFWI